VKRRAGSIVLGVLATAAFVAVAWLAPQHRSVAARAYLIALATLSIRAFALEVYRIIPLGPGSRRAARPGRPGVPDGLGRIERALALAPGSARETHHRLRPILRAIAAGRLEVRRRIDLDAEPERARSVLGEDAFELLRGGRPMPGEPQSSGIDTTEIAEIVDRLEAI
jgi:hypothetical protein